MGKIKNGIRWMFRDPWLAVRKMCYSGVFNNLSDETYLRILFKATMKKRLDLKSPTTFNEKLQWLKLHDRKPIYTTMVDKYAVKDYVASIIGEEYIIPTLGVWDKFDEIDFDSLPNQFVLKCTHDSGSLSICRDKEHFDIAKAKDKIEKFLRMDYYKYGREWPYKNVQRKIIAEKYMQDDNNPSLTDYKFYCFDGVPQFMYISEGLEDHQTARISFLNMDWTKAPFGRTDYKEYDLLPGKPAKFEEMVNLSRKVSIDVPFVRVDWYFIDSRVYFSEFTFSPCGGFMIFNPEKYDRIVGDMLNLPL